MSLYKVAKTLNEIKEERSHRNRRVHAAPYIAGGVAAAASVTHDTTRKTGAVQMKMKGNKLTRGPQREYHLLRNGSKTVGKHVENSVMRAMPRAAAAGFATAGAGALYKYVAEERARRQEKARRRELTKRASMDEIRAQRKKGLGQVAGSGIVMAGLPAMIGAQIAGYEVGRKNLLKSEGRKAILRHGKSAAKMVGKYAVPMLAGSALFHEARYRIRKHNLQKAQTAGKI